ncbi:aspartic peptidase domain-containing protein [Mycena vitilis]|nr:aspartic peptidase domain-containing protein [Mycena vitilis]
MGMDPRSAGPSIRVSVAGVTVKDQYSSPVATLSSFATNPADGLLELAFPALSSLGQNPFFASAIINKDESLKKNQFGFFLAATGSSLFLGGSDTSKYSEEPEFHGINRRSGFWQLTGATVKVDSTAVVSSFETTIDSGTTLMYGPPDAVNDLILTSFEALTYCIQLGGADWVVSADSIVQAQISYSDCVGTLVGQDIGLGDNVWLLGDRFMANVYSVFDFDQNAVGFAALSTAGNASVDFTREREGLEKTEVPEGE